MDPKESWNESASQKLLGVGGFYRWTTFHMTGTNRKAPPLGVYLAHNPQEISIHIKKDTNICTRQFRAPGNVERRVEKVVATCFLSAPSHIHFTVYETTTC
jgi:hypothetical protein